MLEEWMSSWQPLVQAIGQDFSDGKQRPGADTISPACIRRYLEPLEFDCALHYDPQAARAHGYSDIVAPCTSVGAFSLPALWEPGTRIFNSPERNAQPDSNTLKGVLTGLEPPTTGFFATDYEADYFLPVTAGDRLRRHGAKLVACEPKETRLGRGAFITWETEILNQHDQVVARTRASFYRYNPRPEGGVR